MSNRPHLLLWTDSPGPYIDAIAKAGLSDRVAIDTLGRREKPSETQRTETNVLLAGGVPPGLLPAMPNLKWAQSLTAGVEGWLALPDLPPNLTLTCARGTHRESMPENILGALFHITKPYAAIAEDKKQSLWRHPAQRQYAGYPRAGRHRAGGRASCHRPGHAGDRHQAPPCPNARPGRGAATRPDQ
jgi:phosphoglycerate dehydrogenase-like enzyme